MLNQNPNNNPVSLDLRPLYRVRMPILLETGPQSNEYRHVLLTKEQAVQVNQLIMHLLKQSNNGTHFTVDKSWSIKLPEEIKEYL